MPAAIQSPAIDRPSLIELRVPIDSAIFLAEDIKIPAGIVDLATFRDWTYSDDFPTRGRIDYMRGTIFVDLSMEQLYTHHRVKNAYIATIESLVEANDVGYPVGDHFRLTLPASDVSTEVDGMFILYESIRTKKIIRKPGRRGGVLEFEGTPDLVLEVVSDSSVDLDATDRPANYRRSGIGEFWRVDARGEKILFEIFVLAAGDYVAVEQKDGWQRSSVFGKWFKFEQDVDPLGEPRFRLRVKD